MTECVDAVTAADYSRNDEMITVYVVELGPDSQHVALVAPGAGEVQLQAEPEINITDAQDSVSGRSSVAIQANDYEIERRSNLLPARKRIIPRKFQDFHDPNNLSEDNDSDTDYIPGDVDLNVPVRKGRRPGRPPGRGRGRRKGTGIDHSYEQPGAAENQEKTANGILDSVVTDGGLLKKNSTVEVVPVDGMYICDINDCRLQFSRQAALRQHQSMHAAPSQRGRPKKGSIRRPASGVMFKCDVCEKKFSQKGNLKAHSLIHTGEKPFCCEQENCGKSFRSNETLKRHMFSHMGVKPFKCDTCGLCFSSKVALCEHRSRHMDARPYRCETCGRHFRQTSCLRRHLATHSSDAPFQCSVCSRRFVQAVYLKSHMRTHTGEKPFLCKVCNKKFAHQSDLIRHHTVHTGAKPFVCDVCGAAFSDPSSRRRHVREHTGARPYECTLCGDHFKRAGQLRMHLAKTHVKKTDVEGDSPSAIDSASGQIARNLVVQSEVYTEEIHSEVDTENIAGEVEVAYKVVENDRGEKMLEIVYGGVVAEETVQPTDMLQPTDVVISEMMQPTGVTTSEIMQPPGVTTSEMMQPPIVATSDVVQPPSVASNEMMQPPGVATGETMQRPDVATSDDIATAAMDSGVAMDDCVATETVILAGNVNTLSVDTPATTDSVIVTYNSNTLGEPVKSVSSSPDRTVHVPIAPSDVQVDTPLYVRASTEISTPVDYSVHPDFTSQEYYDWLASFVTAMSTTPLPLDAPLFYRLSTTHKSLTDALATMTGAVADPDNFRALVAISDDLGAIVSAHLTQVLNNMNAN